MGRRMGFDFGLDKNPCFKRKYRWLFEIEGVSADGSPSTGTNALPPEKSARPSLNFKEMQVEHINETIYYPSKPDWKPISLVLYDLKKTKHPVFEWLKSAYNPEKGTWLPSGTRAFKKDAKLKLFDGCGNLIECWKYENIWPQTIEFGELDMGVSEVVTVELTLRYDRSFICSNNPGEGGSPPPDEPSPGEEGGDQGFVNIGPIDDSTPLR